MMKMALACRYSTRSSRSSHSTCSHGKNQIRVRGQRSGVREGTAAVGLTLWMCETWLKDRSSQESSEGSDRKWLMGRKRSCSSLMLLLLKRSERLLYFLSASRLRGRKPRVGSIFHDSDTHTHTLKVRFSFCAHWVQCLARGHNRLGWRGDRY